MTPQTAARAILADMMTRKGFPQFFNTVAPETQAAVLDAWEEIISQVESEERAIGQWFPIESAPKDGSPFLIYQPHRAETDRVMVAYRNSPSSRTDDILSLPGLWQMKNATHWKCIPPAPIDEPDA